MPAGTLSAGGSLHQRAFSLEVSAKACALRVPGGSRAVRSSPFPGWPARTTTPYAVAVRTVRALGFEPMPHLSARRIGSRTALERLERATSEGVGGAALLIAGDLATPAGPFADSASIIETGRLERFGIRS